MLVGAIKINGTLSDVIFLLKNNFVGGNAWNFIRSVYIYNNRTDVKTKIM